MKGVIFMKKSIIGMIFATASICSLAGCNETKPSSTGKKFPLDQREGYQEKFDGFYSEVHRVKNTTDSNSIYGRLFKPDDFSPDKEYPVLIMSHGYNSSGESGTNALVKNILSHGMLCYTYDFCGGSNVSKSEGKTTEMSVLTEITDLESVLADIKEMQFIDDKKIALFGQSFGGLVTSLTAPKHLNDIAGVILQAPALTMSSPYQSEEEIPEVTENQFMKVGKKFYKDLMTIDVSTEISKWNKDIMIYVGTEDSFHEGVVEKSRSYTAEQKFHFAEDTETVWMEEGVHIVKDAPHSFQKEDFAKIMPEINAYLQHLDFFD